MSGESDWRIAKTPDFPATVMRAFSSDRCAFHEIIPFSRMHFVQEPRGELAD